MRILRLAIFVLASLPGSVGWAGELSEAHARRPNILLIVADDLGYADLGAFGSDIHTPNLDALARVGIRFSQFHTASMCAPSRAMLLSGNNNHVAGMANQSQSGILGNAFPAYEAHLSDRIVPFPRLLQRAGYRTHIVGKWHLGAPAAHGPRAAGFDRSFTLLHGAANHWNGAGFFAGGSVYEANDQLSQWPEGQFSTEVYTDRLIEFIERDRAEGHAEPFFAMASYTAPHWPLQVPTEELDRYRGQYDEGYDVLRELNFNRLKAAGIIAESAQLSPRDPEVTPWQRLDTLQQRRESRKMELYAAMVSNLDAHIGRLVEYLEETGLRNNTMIVFISDNGAAGEDFYNSPERQEFYDYTRAHYDNRLDNMGHPDSFVSYGIPWAQAGSAPFRGIKGHAHEGGITAPMIISGPLIEGRGRIEHGYVDILDLAPTFLALAGARYPADNQIRAPRGASLLPFLTGQSDTIPGQHEVTVYFHRGWGMIRSGNWKLINADWPFSESSLELFDVRADPGETRNLRQSQPAVYRQLLETWREERKELGIVLPEDL